MHINAIKLRLAAAMTVVATCCIVFAFTASSCGSGGGDDSDIDTAQYTALSDTLSQLLGQVYGFEFRNEITNFVKFNPDSVYDTDQFLNGLEVTLAKRHPMAFVSGVMMGLQMDADLQTLAAAGVKIDRKKIFSIIESNVADKDTADASEMDNATEAYKRLSNRLADTPRISSDRLFVDSLENAYARLVSIMIESDISNFKINEGRDFDTPRFMKGIERIFVGAYPQEYLYGAYQATMLSQNIVVLETKGVNVRPSTVLRNIREVFEAKSVDTVLFEQKRRELQRLTERLQRSAFEAEDAEMAKSDKAIQNIKTGEALVAKIKETTPGVKTTSSGLTYLIRKEGEGPKITDSDTVTVRYTGSHLDNKVFDINQSQKFVVAELFPGLREGLTMLQKGSKASFWIPGKLAFGGHGIPALGVGPMETVIIDIEVLEIAPVR